MCGPGPMAAGRICEHCEGEAILYTKASEMNTIICGVDTSPGARIALRVAASIAEELNARLVAVHVLDRLAGSDRSAERMAAGVVREELGEADVETRGEVGNVAER